MPMTKTDSTLPSVQIAEDTTESKGNYEAVRFNAMRHGILSRLTVLPHENLDEFAGLLAALIQEHKPVGATESHLVEELAGVIWRKRRVLLAEGASINRGLRKATRNAETVIPTAVPFESDLTGKSTDLQNFLAMSPEELAEHQQESTHDLEVTQKAAGILECGGAKAYDKALRVLLPDSREWWQELVGEEEYPANAEGLADFICEHLEPHCMSVEKEAQHHAAIKAQTLGEGLQAYQLEKLNRYETHLDRKFERTLAMLVKLKDIRASNRAAK